MIFIYLLYGFKTEKAKETEAGQEILGEACGGLDGGKCLEEWDEQQKID